MLFIVSFKRFSPFLYSICLFLCRNNFGSGFSCRFWRHNPFFKNWIYLFSLLFLFFRWILSPFSKIQFSSGQKTPFAGMARHTWYSNYSIYVVWKCRRHLWGFLAGNWIIQKKQTQNKKYKNKYWWDSCFFHDFGN